MQTVYPLGTKLSFLSVGQAQDPNILQILWAHGWMHSHAMLLPLARSLEKLYSNLLIDFPGFGCSPLPPEVWGSGEYANHIAAWLMTVPCKRRVWVGHSFGCRVGIQLARLYPNLVSGLFLIAAAGLPRDRSLWQKLQTKAKIYSYKGLKKMIPLGLNEEWLRERFGSRDYINAGTLRPIFLRIVSEDFTELAKEVCCPVHLIYGEEDTETPPSIGQRYAQIMPHATLTLLPRYDHNSIIVDGRHQILRHLTTFIEKII